MRTSNVFNETPPKVDVSRRGAGRTCLMIVEYVAIVKAGNECQPTAYMSSHGKFCDSSLLRENVVQVKFLLVSLLNTLLAEPESHNALVVIWSGERRTPRITRRDTAQTERILTESKTGSGDIHLPDPTNQGPRRVTQRNLPDCCAA